MNNNNYIIILKRLVLVYVLYSFSRFVFLLANLQHFSQFGPLEILKTFVIGLRFDTTAIIYTNGLFVLLSLLPFAFTHKKYYQFILKWAFVMVNTSAILFNLIDAGYFQFSGKRSGVELFGMSGDIANQSLQYVKDYWYLAIILFACCWLLVKFYPLTQEQKTTPFSAQVAFKKAGFVLFVIILFLLGARGTIGLKPLNTLDAARLTRPELAALTLNTPFQFMMTIQQNGVVEKNYMSQNEAYQYFNPIHQFKEVTLTHKNIVLIIVESLGKEYVGTYNNGKGYTPFLDSLAKHSTVYLNAYANGKRSIEGIPSIVASMPSLMDNDYMNSYYQSNTLQSIGSLLQQINYDASFYHGGKNGTMSFDNFIAATHAGKYYGLNEYPNKQDDDGNWGIYDEPYLHYFATELSQKKQPFFSTVFTLSSHHPYNIPSNRKGLFVEGSLPIHKAIRYSDFSLQQFFQTASRTSWYNNTIFIITADHSSTNEQPKYASVEGMYRIPLIIFDPNKPIEKQYNQTTQQLDLMPQILKLTGFNKPFFSFGNNIDSPETSFAMQYINNTYQLIQYPFVLHFDGDHVTGFFKINGNQELEQSGDEASKKRLVLIVKSYLQQYNHALIHNETTIVN